MGALFSSESPEEKENKKEMALEKAKQIASSNPVAVFRFPSSLLSALLSWFCYLLIDQGEILDLNLSETLNLFAICTNRCCICDF